MKDKINKTHKQKKYAKALCRVHINFKVHQYNSQ